MCEVLSKRAWLLHLLRAIHGTGLTFSRGRQRQQLLRTVKQASLFTVASCPSRPLRDRCSGKEEPLGRQLRRAIAPGPSLGRGCQRYTEQVHNGRSRRLKSRGNTGLATRLVQVLSWAPCLKAPIEE